MTLGKTPGTSRKGIKKIFATSLAEVAGYDAEGIGAIRREGNETYKWVQYKEGTAALDVAAGDVVCYLDYDAATVTADVSDTDSIGAGVIVAVAVTEDSKYCWIQIKGTVTLANDAGGTAPAVGNVVTTNGSSDKGVVVLDALAEQDVGVLIDVTASANVILCDFPF